MPVVIPDPFAVSSYPHKSNVVIVASPTVASLGSLDVGTTVSDPIPPLLP